MSHSTAHCSINNFVRCTYCVYVIICSNIMAVTVLQMQSSDRSSNGNKNYLKVDAHAVYVLISNRDWTMLHSHIHVCICTCIIIVCHAKPLTGKSTKQYHKPGLRAIMFTLCTTLRGSTLQTEGFTNCLEDVWRRHFETVFSFCCRCV